MVGSANSRMRGQTDRNILKAYETLIESLRYKLYMRLIHRFMKSERLTVAQKRFASSHWSKYGTGKHKRERRTKAEIAETKKAKTETYQETSSHLKSHEQKSDVDDGNNK